MDRPYETDMFGAKWYVCKEGGVSPDHTMGTNRGIFALSPSKKMEYLFPPTNNIRSKFRMSMNQGVWIKLRINGIYLLEELYRSTA